MGVSKAFLPHMSGLRGYGCNPPPLHDLPVHSGSARWFWITLRKGSSSEVGCRWSGQKA